MKNGKAENKGGRGAAKCPRPVWVDDRDAAELPNFEPSPALYNCACAFLWDEAQRAFADGDNTLLARAGVADAIEFITNPCNAGTGKAAYAEMLEDWRRAMKAEAAQAEARKAAKMINADLPRIDFWRKFEPDADRDADAMEFRRVFLIRRRGGLLRLMQKMKEQGDVATCDAMTDAFIFPAIDTANPEPEHVRAYWRAKNWRGGYRSPHFRTMKSNLQSCAEESRIISACFPRRLSVWKMIAATCAHRAT